MSVFVVDASVAVKWFFPEVHDAAAGRLLDGSHALLAPDLLFLEVGNALWKRIRRQETTPGEALAVLEALGSIGLHVSPSQQFLQGALGIACRIGHSIYDSVYVAMAIAQDCPLVTADRRLYAAVRRRLPGRVVWVEEPSGSSETR